MSSIKNVRRIWCERSRTLFPLGWHQPSINNQDPIVNEVKAKTLASHHTHIRAFAQTRSHWYVSRARNSSAGRGDLWSGTIEWGLVTEPHARAFLRIDGGNRAERMRSETTTTTTIALWFRVVLCCVVSHWMCWGLCVPLRQQRMTTTLEDPHNISIGKVVRVPTSTFCSERSIQLIRNNPFLELHLK